MVAALLLFYKNKNFFFLKPLTSDLCPAAIEDLSHHGEAVSLTNGEKISTLYVKKETSYEA